MARHREVRKFKTGPKRGQERPSMCDTYHRCEKCLVTIDITKRSMDDHTCSEWYCRGCLSYVISPHFCYHRAAKPREDEDKHRYIFYDYETSQSEMFTCGDFKCLPLDDCPDCGFDSSGVKVLCTSCR